MAREADFSQKTIDTLQKSAAFICSNPVCKIMTVAQSETDFDKVVYVGKAAHISAAEPGGARYDQTITLEKRKSISNAIFLCSNCADMIDKNKGIDYSVEILTQWKKDHESWVRSNLNKRPSNFSISNSIINSKNINTQYYIENYTGELPSQQIIDNKKHDIDNFDRLNSLLPEDLLNNIFNRLTTYDSITHKSNTVIRSFIENSLKRDSDFLDEALELGKRSFVESIILLDKYVSYNFFPYQNAGVKREDHEYHLYPALNCEKDGTGFPSDMAKYDNYQNKLDEKVRNAREAYENYRDLYTLFKKSS